MLYKRMPIEIESPEEMGYANIRYNLAESSVRDKTLGELQVGSLEEVMLCYGEHLGHTPLRDVIAAEYPGLHPDDVLVTTGAAMALFVVATTLLDRGDHLVVIRPNYGTNLETPRGIGCDMTVVDLQFEMQFALDAERILTAIRPNTRLISLTNPHNPTGQLFPQETIDRIIEHAAARGIYVLVDETYRDNNFQTPLYPYAACRSEKVISISSLSKAYGTPGLRCGWLICRDTVLMQRFLAAKEQICIGSNVLDEVIAARMLARKAALMADSHAFVRHNYQLLQAGLATMPWLEWVPPQAGVVCFPRLHEGARLDFPRFQTALYRDYQTVVGFGHWFEQPERYFRIGFGFPLPEELEEGLRRFKQCVEECLM